MSGTHSEWARRDGAEHKRRAFKWKNLPPDKREAHFNLHGARWFELARLPYFDPVRMSVIDPMHCLLLGVLPRMGRVIAKTCRHRQESLVLYMDQEHKGPTRGHCSTRPRVDLRAQPPTRGASLWILNRGLSHVSLQLEAPPWLGRLPKHVGEPKGGNLGADEYKVLTTTYGPVVVCLPLRMTTQHCSDLKAVPRSVVAATR